MLQLMMTTIMTNLIFQNKLALNLYWFAFTMIWLKRKLSCTRSIKSRAARAERWKEQMGHAMWNKHIEILLMSTLILKELPRYVWQKRMLHCLSQKHYRLFWNIFRKHLTHLEFIHSSTFRKRYQTWEHAWIKLSHLHYSLLIIFVDSWLSSTADY